MKAVIQRVLNANVVVEEKIVGAVGKGFLILLGVARGDTEAEVDILAEKILKLRVFSDENGKMNRSILDVGGEILVVSQFTLLANCRHGNRPDFLESAPPELANRLYELFKEKIREKIENVACGIFGADMQVTLVNDGPVTILLDTETLKKK
ncbi:MAG: D-tyrosyl-tRNA(Tyr) deacylase [Ruminococcaceae bacterium]|nr:D-tyrosyl-tRNA(Tyr) deacylase [Oscillospiraceae bacterium]